MLPISHTIGIEVAVDLSHHHSLINLAKFVNLTSVIKPTSVINPRSIINLMNSGDPTSFQANLKPISRTIGTEVNINS